MAASSVQYALSLKAASGISRRACVKLIAIAALGRVGHVPHPYATPGT
jgi:hypothetical protein